METDKPKYKNCKECDVYQRLRQIKERILKVPKLGTSIDYKTCIDDVMSIILKNKEEEKKEKEDEFVRS